jgi:MFS superfamily sulfate permease-like transporter
MSLDAIGQLNWLAVILGAVIYFALGAVWFTPLLFGRQWQMKPSAYLIPAVAYLVAAIATGLLAAGTGSDTLPEGIVLGVVVGVGYAVTLTAVEAVFDPNKPQPWTWFGISASYHFLGLLIVAVLVSVWR